MKLNITPSELEQCYEEILTILGGFSIDVDIDKKELIIILRRAYQEFFKEISIWQLTNQFSNVYGMPAGMTMFNQISTFNMNMVTQITDWFASMQRVGGKIPWHKDYITLEHGRQIYDLSKESSMPYLPGYRKIHRVMWVGTPETLGTGKFKPTSSGVQGDDVLQSSLWNFTNSGLSYGANPLSFLGYSFDTIMMLQSIETRKKIMFSDFYYNLSGDMLELFPMPGGQSLNIQEGTKLFYYYFDEREVTAGRRISPELLESQDMSPGVIKKIAFSGVVGSTKNFTLLSPIQQGTEMVVLNGVQLTKNTDFTYDATTNQIKLSDEFRVLNSSDSFTIHASENIINNDDVSGLFENEQVLIANPAQMKIDVIPWSMLSVWAKTWIWEWALARCKYIQGSKWRKIKKIFNASDAGFEIDFDYGSLIDEAKDELSTLKESLRQDLQNLNLSKLLQDKQAMVDAAVAINKRTGRMRFTK